MKRAGWIQISPWEWKTGGKSDGNEVEAQGRGIGYQRKNESWLILSALCITKNGMLW